METRRFDIFVVAVRAEKARHIVARHLAEDPAISLEKARSMLAAPPVVYSRNVEAKEAARQQTYLERLGVEVKLVPARAVPPSPPVVPVPKPDASPQPPSQPPPPKPSAPASSKAASPARPAPPEPRRVSTSSVSFGQTPRPRRRLSDTGKVLVTLAVLILVAILLFRAQSRRRFAINQTGPLPGGGSSGQRHAIVGEGADAGRDSTVSSKGGRSDISAEDRSHAAAYIDSASRSGEQWRQAIRFYKIALSFNRYNIGAWHGLVNAYRQGGMDAEAEEALARMRELFGDKASDIAEIVKPHGELMDFYEEAEGTCRLEYTSRVKGRDDLVRQAYAITRALTVELRCRTVSLYASTGKGRGLLVQARAERLPPTPSAFEQQATISYLE